MSSKQILVIGGSGFLSGTLVTAALHAGNSVYVVTRGQRPVPNGARALVADRHDSRAFAAAVDEGLRQAGGRFDLVVDAIPFSPDDARQDVEAFGGRTGRLVFVSTDFVYDPLRRRFPQTEDGAEYVQHGYGGNKRKAEEVLLAAGTDDVPWVVLRPGHIYGPGSQLGCLPPLGRDPGLISRLRAGTPVELLGGGHFLQQPVFVGDLVRVILELGDAAPEPTVGNIMNVAGPEIIESVEYYRIVAEALGVDLKVDEIPVAAYARDNPDKASFICHRFYDLSRLAATGVQLPATRLADGLNTHVSALLDG
ncbi:MAG: NAD-dependent epimerase/dehydratase family protein [Spirochaetaceae bacterium]|nr:MAG: NAD-dependent epimerase/dehydratase family protein [Spirochaetaceae bacterium]